MTAQMTKLQYNHVKKYILANVNLLELLQTKYEFSLKEEQDNRFKMCCPLHSEKTASFIVYMNTNSFFCFGCSVGGSVIDFMMEYEGLSYGEVIDIFKGDTDVLSGKIITDGIISQIRGKKFNTEKYKKDIQYSLGIYFRDYMYKHPEKFELVIDCYRDMDMFFSNEEKMTETQVSNFSDHMIERIVA